jgi:ABC-2 type transport system ATP-binding protein
MIITVRDLVKRYGSLTAIDHLNLSIREHEIYGLLGPNGSGKTTLINTILSILSFDQGEIEVFGKEMRPDAYDLKRKIGVVPQDIAVFAELTVTENIDYFCGLYVDDRTERKTLVEEAIAFTGLGDFRKFRPKALSGGLKRRLNIACGIAHRPELLFLDEPTVAVDPQSRNHILEGVSRLCSELGVTAVYTTHYMEEAEQICDRVGILDSGRLIAEGTPDELKSSIASGDQIKVTLLERDETKLKAIEAIDGVVLCEFSDDELTIHTAPKSRVLEPLITLLNENNITYASLSTEKPTLNTVFLEITGRALRDRENGI